MTVRTYDDATFPGFERWAERNAQYIDGFSAGGAAVAIANRLWFTALVFAGIFFGALLAGYLRRVGGYRWTQGGTNGSGSSHSEGRWERQVDTAPRPAHNDH